MTRGATARKARQEAPPEPVAFLLPRELAQSFLNYLTSRPYGEVFQLVSALRSLDALTDDQVEALSEPAEE